MKLLESLNLLCQKRLDAMSKSAKAWDKSGDADDEDSHNQAAKAHMEASDDEADKGNFSAAQGHARQADKHKTMAKDCAAKP